MNCKVKFSEESPYFRRGVKEDVIVDVTEIHFNYDGRGRIAFEQDSLGTGRTFDLKEIKEFEAK